MNVLVISRNAWDDTNAIGNTLSNFFTGIDDAEFANVYFRSASPNNKICNNYYHVTETEIVKKWFTPSKIGKQFSFSDEIITHKKTKLQKKEKTLVSLIRNNNLKLAYWLSDCIWYSKKWQNKNLDEFIENFNPDVAITFVKSSPQYYLMVRYLREKYDIPIFSWIADDEYTGLQKKKSIREIEKLKYILNESAVVKGCSQKICNYYNSVFKCNAEPLYKGCKFTNTVKSHISKPLRMIYSGNLLYGRQEIIKQIARVLDSYDPDGQKVNFEIYSNTTLDEGDKHFFEACTCSSFMGCLDYQGIKERLEQADINLLVESFEESQILKTKYSFSTKIIDYLQSGSIILAIGPKEISSIEYVKQIPGAYVIDCMNLLEERIGEILDDYENFMYRKQQIRQFAENNHNYSKNVKRIKDILIECAKEGK